MRRVTVEVCAFAIVLLLSQGLSATTVEYQIAASADDTHCSSGSNYVTNDNINFPYNSDAERRPFFRWAVNIPEGATIESAYLKVRSWSTRSVDTSIRLWLLDYDDCPAFSTNPFSWSMASGTSVDWALPNPFTADTWYTSPDIKSLVQAFVDRAGYESGNYLGMRGQWLSGAYRWIYQRDGDTDSGAKLEVTYSTNVAPVADAGSDQNVSDSDDSGSETVTLDGSGSSDSDGTITSYVWTEGTAQIATGETAQVSLAVGEHTITLTVTDDDAATDADTVVVTVSDVTTVEYQVAASADDTHCSSGSNYVGNQNMNFPYNNDTERRPFLRWAVNIPDGATIESAYLKVKAQTTSSTNATIRLWVLDYDDCPAFSTNPFSWSMMSGTSVDWVLPNPFTVDTWYTSPDVKTLVQAFIDRSGYTSGNYLGMRGQWISGAYKYIYQYYYSPDNAAILEVTYSTGEPSNQPPVASAGSDQNVTDTDDSGSETVSLDGSGSSDSDGTIASYVWTEGTSQIATGESPQVSLAVGVHTITLTVTDDDAATDADTVQVTVNAYQNVAPVADAGSDQNVTDTDDSGSETVTLDGSGSSDSDGTITSWVWTEGTAQIATGESPQVSLAVGVHTITLAVTDDDAATDADTVQVSVNGPPVADAGSDQNVSDNDDSGSETVTLDGSGSSDSDGTITSYVWTEGTAQIATGETAQVSLAVGVHTIILTVTDDDAATDTDTVVVDVNGPPVADAGSDQNVVDTDESGSETVTLDGSGSSDADGTITSWVWTEGTAQIATGETAQASLAVGVHTITLAVTDNDGATDADTVVVTVATETTTEYQMAASADDTATTSTSNNYGTTIMYWPYSTTERRSFVRFGLDIPPGATVASAYLSVKSAGGKGNSDPATVRLQLLDQDDCPSFYPTNPFAWDVTETTVDWQVPGAWVADTWYTSPDVKTLVQEFVDRAGYTSGNHIGLRGMWAAGSYKTAYQWNNDPNDGATLEVTYSGGNFKPVADAGSDQEVIDTDYNGSELVTLDGSASSDSDGTIASWVWTEGTAQIATGETAQVALGAGEHTLTLTVTDNDGATDDDTVAVTVHSLWYVDFADGSDAASGTSPGAAWKHCPGDPDATGVPGSMTLIGGDKVVFKGGVTYRGSIACNWSGSAGQTIIYDGNTAATFGTGKAIFDGSQPLTGWTQCQSAAEAGGNPNWANIWYAYAPAGTNANTSNLYQYDTSTQTEEMCWMAQGPNQGEPFFMDSISGFYTIACANVTTTALTDTARLTQTDPDYWDGAFVMVWVQPNMVDARAINSFDPNTDTITYDTIGNPYTDRDEYYAIYNHISLIDQAGEYYFNDTAEGNGTHKVWLWPPVGSPSTYPISVSVPAARDRAFSIGANTSYLTFDGLEIQKFAGGAGSYSGSGITHGGAGGVANVTITDCDFAYIRHDFRGGNGYGAVTLGGSGHTVSGNSFVELPATNAMQFGVSNSVIEDNYIERPGRMGIWMTFSNCQIIGNVMTDVRGTHADGIAVFQGSSNVTIMGNTILNSSVPICTQSSSYVTVAYNYLHCPSMYAYADYGGCTNLKIHNNTLLRDDEYPSLRNDSGGEAKNNIRYTYSGQGSLTPDANGNLTINHSMDTTVFADPANDDYSLDPNSPAVDAGLDLDYEYDIEGTAVPQGDDPDIGAFELEQ